MNPPKTEEEIKTGFVEWVKFKFPQPQRMHEIPLFLLRAGWLNAVFIEGVRFAETDTNPSQTIT